MNAAVVPVGSHPVSASVPLSFGSGKPIRISHSRMQKMQTCGRAYMHAYVDRIESIKVGAALPIGTIAHKVFSAVLTALALGGTIDPMAMFEREWAKVEATQSIQWSTQIGPDDVRPMAGLILQTFQEAWTGLGLQVAMDAEGLPVVERELEVMLPGNILYNGVIDLLAIAPDGTYVLIDWKAVHQLFQRDGLMSFAEYSDQLVGQQILVQANAVALGMPRGAKLDRAFAEIVKAKPLKEKPAPKKPRKVPLKEKAPRKLFHFDRTGSADAERIADYLREVAFIAEDIRRERFTRRSFAQYSTSCDMCDYARKCRGQEDPFLRPKPSRETVEGAPAPLL
jgi:hypothetical protein